MVEPEFRVTQIVYVTDVTRADSQVIALGVFAEMANNDWHGLALKARKTLTKAELSEVSPLLRDALADPFAYLRGEFNDAWDNAEPGRALEYLARRHNAGLRILTPTDCAERNWLRDRLMSPRKEALEAKLMAAVDTAFGKLLGTDATPGDSNKIFAEGTKAAA
jgi:hypothetical protein